jgi:hypothetical protein
MSGREIQQKFFRALIQPIQHTSALLMVPHFPSHVFQDLFQERILTTDPYLYSQISPRFSPSKVSWFSTSSRLAFGKHFPCVAILWVMCHLCTHFFGSCGCERSSNYIANFKKIAFSLSMGQTLVSYPALQVLIVKHIHYEQMKYSDIAQKSPFQQALI